MFVLNLCHTFSLKMFVLLQKVVVEVERGITKHLGVLESLLLKYVRVRRWDIIALGLGSCGVEMEHFNDKNFPEVQFLNQFQPLLS